MSKLELKWLDKDKEEKIEPRILMEDISKSYKKNEEGLFDNGIYDNLLIHGDNLLALKAIEQKFANRIKCIYIDPPYNTRNALEYYDDNREHSTWLNLMYPRLKILFNLLKDGGSIWVSIDDIESHRLRLIMDEIFGVTGFVADITYERSGSAGLGQGGLFVNNSEHILVYSKGVFQYNPVLGSSLLELKTMKRYNKVLKSEGQRELIDEFESKSNGSIVKIYKHSNFQIESISLKNFEKNEKEIRKEFLDNFEHLFRTNNVQKENEFQNDLMSRMEKTSLYTVDYVPSRGKYKNQKTTLYYYNSELFAWLKDTAYIEDGNIVKTNKLTTVWRHEEIPKADLANEGGVDFPRSKKPEQLIKRILEIATNPGDWVLDSFLGSGTTAAVAHKMKRKWIGIEMGEHAYSHAKYRLDRIIDGQDPIGVTKSCGWTSGGGYKFFELAPTLINEDEFGQAIINPQYNPVMLAAAIALHEGYNYSPSKDCFWKQSLNENNSYLFVTTTHVTKQMIDSILVDLKEDEHLLISCKSYDTNVIAGIKNISIKKIPQSLLKNCEFGKDNYNLNIICPPVYEEDEEDE
ncbi:MAG: site-specific DNA-methyltransferase [Acholeplasmatales bacterium]|nr:site-specific DNA-methyltransferase [Acholeplasmatales bacterium]